MNKSQNLSEEDDGFELLRKGYIDAMKSMHITHALLARRIGISHNHLTRILSDDREHRTVPNCNLAFKIARILHLLQEIVEDAIRREYQKTEHLLQIDSVEEKMQSFKGRLPELYQHFRHAESDLCDFIFEAQKESTVSITTAKTENDISLHVTKTPVEAPHTS